MQSGLVTMEVVFSQEPGAGTTSLHVDLMPLSARKQPAGTNPRHWATGALGAATAAIAVGGSRAALRRRG